MTELGMFYERVQIQYLDNILEFIGDNEARFENAVDIMERIISYESNKIHFEQIVDFVISCEKKVVLSIKGLQGTGKSTFLSLIYYRIKQKSNETNVFPILIDLHALDNYSKKKAKDILLEHLEIINGVIKRYQDKKFILLFDGADDYVRKTSDLENVIYRYVDTNNLSNFAFCMLEKRLGIRV